MNSVLPMADAVSANSKLQASRTSWFGWSDWVGMVASIGCAVHCAAMPFAIAYLPALGLGFLADESFHKWMAVGCFVIALSAFVPGFRKHRRLTPVIIGSCGLVMITVAAFGFAGECCAACENETPAVALVTSVNSENAVASITASPANAEVCTEACCADHAGQNVSAVSTSTNQDSPLKGSSSAGVPLQASSPTSLGRLIVPWLTSFGGIVLVVAHLINRRFGCLCGCCDSEVAEVSV